MYNGPDKDLLEILKIAMNQNQRILEMNAQVIRAATTPPLMQFDLGKTPAPKDVEVLKSIEVPKSKTTFGGMI